jgi:hypothetical protein
LDFGAIDAVISQTKLSNPSWFKVAQCRPLNLFVGSALADPIAIGISLDRTAVHRFHNHLK